jgi:hypothetical protein
MQNDRAIPQTTARECAELLADRAGLARHPNRETWIKACVQILEAQRGIGHAEAIREMEEALAAEYRRGFKEGVAYGRIPF